MLGHKLSLGKFKKMKIISNIFPDHNTMILEIHYKKKKKTLRNTNTWQLNHMLLNNIESLKKSKKKQKMPGDK